ncbi:MAG: alpha/beta hydrolase [Myxococcales bacterium]|nr:alpha/beta hydrolase [Myxococcales bacterium]
MPETPWLLLSLGVLSIGLSINALRPRRGLALLLPSFFAAWWTTELALHSLLIQLGLAFLLVAEGALEGVGLVGAALLLASWALLLVIQREGHRADVAIRAALDNAGVDLSDPLTRYPRTHLLVPPLMFWRRDVDVVHDVPFTDPSETGGRPLHLDIYRPRERDGQRRPAIVQVHGGAWVIGFKGYQGIPLLTHLAANGWVGFNVDYRLSPRASWPDHLVDVKRAIAWIRAHADELGVDPDFIVVTGGSAGGHLTAMTALTANDPEYQPGFEDADTAVQGAVVFYGVFDISNRLGNKPPSYLRIIEQILMKRRFADDPDAYDRASPLQRVRADAPPVFIIHGSQDNLAPVVDARAFAERLREASDDLVLYAELPGAAHAFDVFPSMRTVAVIEAVERFLDRLHRGHRRGIRAKRPQS